MRTLVGMPLALIAVLFTSAVLSTNANASGEDSETLARFDKAWHFRGPERGRIFFTIREDGTVGKVLMAEPSKSHEIDDRAEVMVKTSGPYRALANGDKTIACYEYIYGPAPSLRKAYGAAKFLNYMERSRDIHSLN